MKTPPVTALITCHELISLTASGHRFSHACNACDHEFTQILDMHTGTIHAGTHLPHSPTTYTHKWKPCKGISSILMFKSVRTIYIHSSPPHVKHSALLHILYTDHLSHHVCEHCELLFISFASSANKAVSATNNRLVTSISPRKYKPTILYFTLNCLCTGKTYKSRDKTQP